MGNDLLTPSIIAKEALMQLKNNLVMGNCVHRDYKKEFVKIGNSVTIRKPVKYVVSDGATLETQDTSEQSTSIIINKRKHVGMAFSTLDLTLTIQEFSKRYITPAMIQLANQVDSDLCGLYKDVWMNTGTAGTTLTAYSDVSAPAKRLDKASVPRADRYLVCNPNSEWAIAGLMTTLYNPQMVADSIRNATIGKMAGFEVKGDQNIKTHTRGTHDANYVIDGGGQTGSTLTVKTGSGSWLAGDVFTITGVYAVNPISRETTDVLQEFTVTEDTGTGSVTSISISPSIITSGAYQNVDYAPADGQALNRKTNNHVANLAFHKNAFALVTCPLQLPDGAAWKEQVSYDGLSIRLVKDYDIKSDMETVRLDILYGVKTIYADLACRMFG